MLDTARRLLEGRLRDPLDNRGWVSSADIAADLGEPRAAVVEVLMALGREGLLDVRATHVGLDMEVTGVRVTG